MTIFFRYPTLLLLAGACFFGTQATSDVIAIHCVPVIVSVLPHDPAAFTQGLLFEKGALYESTGLYGQSSLRKINPANGKVVKQVSCPDIFAEGLAVKDGMLVQLSWKEQKALVYGCNDFSVKKTFPYQGEGWGLTTNGPEYIMSNGSDTLYFRSKSFAVTRKLPVVCNGTGVQNLNELEYANNKIYANIWYSNTIVEISPQTGAVTRIIDCTELVRKAAPASPDDVLNGIAYNPKSRTFYVTGKNWKTMFIVRW
jgi:glutamine cyclotransferase